MAYVLSRILECPDLVERSRFEARNFAKLCGVSPRQLQREFKRHFKCTPQSWLNEQRIVFASRLLLMGHRIKSAALDSGFKQVSHFCREFKSKTGMTPSEFCSYLSRPMVLNCRSQITKWR
jgi:AraC-like DNA-binding protein